MIVLKASSEPSFTRLSLTSISPKFFGAVALVFSLIGIACASILVVVAQSEISPYATTFNRLFLAVPVFFIWHSLQTQDQESDDSTRGYVKKLGNFLLPSHWQRSDIYLLLIAGLSFAGSLNLWAWSLNQTSVANATLLDNMLPIFTTLGGWLLFRETFSKTFLLGMGVAIIGVIAISVEDLQLADGCFSGDIAALVASLLAAVNILCLDRLRPRYGAPWLMLWTSLIGSLFTACILVVSGEIFFPSTLSTWTALVALAVVSQTLGQGLLTYALKEFSSGLVTVSMLAIPIIAALMAVVAFNETLSMVNCLAFGIVLVGIYISITAQMTVNAIDISNNIVLLEGDSLATPDLPHNTVVVAVESQEVKASGLGIEELAAM